MSILKSVEALSRKSLKELHYLDIVVIYVYVIILTYTYWQNRRLPVSDDTEWPI